MSGNLVQDKEHSSLQLEEEFSLNEITPEKTIDEPPIDMSQVSQDPPEPTNAGNPDTEEE